MNARPAPDARSYFHLDTAGSFQKVQSPPASVVPIDLTTYVVTLAAGADLLLGGHPKPVVAHTATYAAAILWLREAIERLHLDASKLSSDRLHLALSAIVARTADRLRDEIDACLFDLMSQERTSP